MKKPVALKIFLGYLAIVIIFGALILLFSFRLIRQHYIDSQAQQLQHWQKSLEVQVWPLLEEKRFQELDSWAKDFAKLVEARITVVDPEGKVLADSEENRDEMESHRYRPEIQQALEGRVGKSLRYSSTLKEKMLYVALPLQKGGQIQGVLRVSLFVRDIDLLLSALKKNMALVAGAIILLFLILAFFISRNISRPIRELTLASRRVAGGDFQGKVHLRSQDEFHDLGLAFNFMTGRIKALFEDLSRKKDELDSIISSIPEGIVTLDKEGKISFSNQSFKDFIGNEAIEGKLYWEVFRKPDLWGVVEKAKQEGRTVADEMMFDDKAYVCLAVPLPLRSEIIVMLHDITHIKKLGQVKKDFVTNVSHELRTPLTAIKGYVETLETEIGPEQKGYVDIIKRNIERLINIVTDLLTLSQVEEKSVALEIEEVDVRTLAEYAFKIFEPRAREKNLSMELRAEPHLPRLKGDPFRLEQLLINLIDNAVKYTERGTITISLRPQNNNVIFEVQDTGTGISQEHLDRIFERFYVVDKSRSRKMGGTGLGLSIVKHIVQLHNGQIQVESSPGKGTKFTVILPYSAPD
jgi:two-component system phosphate regulon sensor histidine kinase PhoR